MKIEVKVKDNKITFECIAENPLEGAICGVILNSDIQVTAFNFNGNLGVGFNFTEELPQQ
jgi:hypothetical protein